VKASVFVGASVDGFIARPDGGLDWLPHGGGEEHGYEAFMASVDALVIGSHTYETVLAFDTWPYGEKPVFVLTTRPLRQPPPGAIVQALSGAPADIVTRLAGLGVQHAYVDGGLTIQGFLKAGLIQRLIITRVPVLIGVGIPLFGATNGDVPLRHVATRHYASGLVQTEYEITAPDSAAVGAPAPPSP
jgi:dihydrofolate reductase